MATLLDLAQITGHKSISDMTDEELREHLRLIRQSRKTPKAKPKSSTSSTKKPKSTKQTAQATAMPDIDNLSPEQAAALLAKLGGE